MHLYFASKKLLIATFNYILIKHPRLIEFKFFIFFLVWVAANSSKKVLCSSRERTSKGTVAVGSSK